MNLPPMSIMRMQLCLAVSLVLGGGNLVVEAADVSPAAPTTVEEQRTQPLSTSPSPDPEDVQERGLLPGLTAPIGAQGGVLSPGDRYRAPTPSLTAIANAIRVTFRSVTVNLRIPPNLPVTVPVEISVGYFSPANAQRLTQTYDKGTGTLIQYNDKESDGNPRPMRLDITLRELPNGQSFTFSPQLSLTPLYDVHIGPLTFRLHHDCDLVGKSEIDLDWRSPDDRHHTVSFSTKALEARLFNDFVWFGNQLSANSNVHDVPVRFFENDPHVPGGVYRPPLDPTGTPLLPGQTQHFDYLLTQGNVGPNHQTTNVDLNKCQANVKYDITRKLLTFPNL